MLAEFYEDAKKLSAHVLTVDTDNREAHCETCDQRRPCPCQDECQDENEELIDVFKQALRSSQALRTTLHHRRG